MTTPTTQIIVKIRSIKGRLRMQSVADQKFIQGPREWRETHPVMVPLLLEASLRSDGKCWVAKGEPPRVPA